MFISRVMAGEDRSAYSNFWFSPTPSRTGAGAAVTPDRALCLPAFYAGVRVLTESFAVLPLRVYRKTGAASKTLLNDHWLYDLFRRPNAFQTPFEWREMVQGHLVMRGNAYNRILTDRSGNITGLIPLHPDRMKIELLNTGTDLDYRYRYSDRFNVETVYSRADIWHLRGLSSDGIVGLSPLDLARDAVGLGLAAQDYGSRFFMNDAKPGGWIEFPGNFKDKAARETFRESWQQAHTGGNRGKVGVLEFGMKFHELGLTNVESQFLEARQFQLSDIARILRIPPHLIGDLSKATFSNIEQQSLDFVIHAMTPWAERWESSIETNLLLADDADIEVEADFTALLRGDQVARSTYYHNGITDGWLTRNDARGREGEEALPGLDKPLLPLNMATVDENGDTETPEPPPGAAAPKPTNSADARLAAVLRHNAARMAKRITGGKMPTTDVLAEALCIHPDHAAAWLASPPLCSTKGDEKAITELLLELAA